MIRFSQKSVRSFCSRPFLSLVQDGQDLQTQVDSFQNHLQTIMNFDQETKQLHQQLDRALLSQSINSQTPLKSILIQFELSNKRGFDEDLIGKVCEYLGKTANLYRNHARVYKDLSKDELFENWRFLDLVQEIKYGLRSEQFISEQNLAKISKGLAQIGFHDQDLQHQIFKKLQQLFLKAPFQNTESPQAHKPFYYNIQAPLMDLRGPIMDILTQEREQSTDDLVQTIEEVKSILSDNFNHLHNKVKAIEAIRKQYFILLKTSQSLNNIKEDHFLNLQLLELEEKLLENEFISLEDIQNPKFFEDPELNQQRIVQILENYMKIHFQDYEAYMFYHQMAQNLKNKHASEKKNLIKERLNSLALHNAIDFESLAKILHHQAQIAINGEGLPALKNQSHLYKTLESIQQLVNVMPLASLNSLGHLHLASAFAVLGQDSSSSHHMSQFMSLVDWEVLSPEEFSLFIDTLLKCPKIEMNASKLEKQIEKRFDGLNLKQKAQLMLIQRDIGLSISQVQLEQFQQQLVENHDSLLFEHDWKVIELLNLVNLVLPLNQATQFLLNQLPAINNPPQSALKKSVLSILSSLQSQHLEIQKLSIERKIKSQIHFVNDQKIIIIQDLLQPKGYLAHLQATIYNQVLDKKLEIVSIWNFLTVKNQSIQWKEEKEVMENLHAILSLSDPLESLNDVSKLFLPLLDKDLNFRNNQSLFQIGQSLNKISLLKKNQNYITQQAMKLQLQKMFQAFSQLESSLQDDINAIMQKALQKNFYEYLQSQKQIISELESKTEKSLCQSSWMGKRLSCETIVDNKGIIINIDFDPKSILNQSFLHDTNYVQYKSDHRILEKVTLNNLGQIDINSPSNSLLSNVKQVTIIPTGKMTNMIRPIGVKLGGQEFLANQYQKSLDSQTEFLVNLQNFKYEMKQDPELLFQILTESDFIEALIDLKDDPEMVSNQGLNRKSEDYFEYLTFLSTLTPKELLNETLLQQSQKNSQVEYLKSLKEQKLKLIYKKVAQGKISLSKFKEMESKINEALVNTLEEIEKENDQQNYVAYDNAMVYQVSHQSAPNSQKTYVKQLDREVILSNGNLDQALEMKKFQAQQKLIKARIILKQNQKKSLSEKETSFLQNWSSEQGKTTSMSIAMLTQKDQDLFSKSKYSNLQKFKKFKINELILEMSHFISNEVIAYYDQKVNGQEWDLQMPSMALDSSFALAKIENDIFTQSQAMSEYELDQLKALLKINRKESPYLSQIQSEYESKVFPFLDQANLFSNRFNVISEYISVKEQESKQKSFITDMAEKNDATMVQSMWAKSFNKEYYETSSQELSAYISEFANRIYLMSLSPCALLGPFIIALINHPNIAQVDKDKLMGIMEIYEVTPKFTSNQMEMIVSGYSQKENRNKEDFEGLNSDKWTSW